MANSSSFPNTVTTTMEERTEFMVQHTSGCQETHKVAHFLNPTISTMKGLPALERPHVNPSPPNWHLDLHLEGWPDRLENWQEWVMDMESAHGSVWKKAGIYDAIMASMHWITRDNGDDNDDDLITVIAERWCPKTSTFIFPWGEATITLEDMLVLGGFPVLGHPVSLPLENSEDVLIREWLENMHNLHSDTYSGWLNAFWKSNSDLKHEAFLALWLARFVFPCDCDRKVTNRVFSIAVHLARGTRLALAPVVLASIYHDLHLVKESMVALARLDLLKPLVVKLWSPFQFVQAWAWERLPTLRPKANVLDRNDARMAVRLARWSESKGYDVANPQPNLISAGDTFLWRPYTMALDGWSIPSFYIENEAWLDCDDDLGDQFKSLLRCLRACMLVGLDCVEPYNPHRVCMQFGYDQDLPGWVHGQYNDEKIYVPARLHQGEWSRAYAKWWRNTVSCLSSPFSPALRKRKRGVRRNCTNLGVGGSADHALRIPTPKENMKDVDGSNTPDIDDFPEIPPGFENLFNTTGHSIVQKDVAGSSSNPGVPKVLETPPGFNPRSIDAPPGFDSSHAIGKHVLQTKRACLAADGNMSNGASPSAPPVGLVGRLTGAEYQMTFSSQNGSSSMESIGGTGNGSSNFVAELLEANLSKFEGQLGALKESVQICKNSSSMELRAQVPNIKARIVAAIENFNAEV